MIHIYRHYGLDGLVCELLLRGAINTTITPPPTIVATSCTQSSIDDSLEKRLQDKNNKITELWIFDLCPSKPICAMLNKITEFKVMLIDHHKNNEWIQTKYPWVAFNPLQCSARLLARELNIVDLEYLDLIDAVEAWDFHQTASPHRSRGEQLATLLRFLGDAEFLQMFSTDAYADNNPYLSYITQILNKNTNSYVRHIIDSQLHTCACFLDAYANSFKILLATEHYEDIGRCALAHSEGQDIAYVVIANPITNKCNVYSRETSSVDVSAIARRWGGRGGRSAVTFFTNLRQLSIGALAELFTQSSL